MRDYMVSVEEIDMNRSILEYVHVTVLASPCLCELVLVSKQTISSLEPNRHCL